MTPLLVALAISAGAAAPGTPPAADATAVLALDEAVAIALANRPSLRAARGAAEAAEAGARVARGALLPQLGVDARYQATRDIGPGGTPDTTTDAASGGISADLLLWDFGRTAGRWRAARSSAAAAGEDAQASARDVALEVRLAYFGALARAALEDVARETLANDERHLRDTEEMVRTGTRAPIDLARLRTEVATARAALVRAANDTATARTRLAVAMGVPSGSAFSLVAPGLAALAGEDGGPDALHAEAVRARPELAALRASLEAQRQVATAASRWLLPSLHAVASASTSGPVPLDPSYGASAGVTLRWDLFDGLASPAQAEAERARLDVARARLGDLEHQVFEEVANAAGAVATARAELPAAEEAFAAARDLLGLAEARYREGVGNSLELADAQLELATAAAGRVRVRYDLASARAQLLRSLGRDLWE
jgi:outer membrane protein